jgi:hypothetical protein
MVGEVTKPGGGGVVNWDSAVSPGFASIVINPDFRNDPVLAAAVRILDGIPVNAQTELAISFDALPGSIRDSIIVEIGNPSGELVAPATPDEMDYFVNSCEGARACVQLWGKSTPEHVGRIFERLTRIASGLTTAQTELAMAWLEEGLPPSASCAIFLELGR